MKITTNARFIEELSGLGVAYTVEKCMRPIILPLVIGK